MIKYFCDKCGFEVGQAVAYRQYSNSRGKEMILCSTCSKIYNKVMYDADKKFFDEVNGK